MYGACRSIRLQRVLHTLAAMMLLAFVASGCSKKKEPESTPATGSRDTTAMGGTAYPDTARHAMADTSGARGAAMAMIEGRSGSNLTGHAMFTPAPGGGVHITLDLAGAPPGKHGVHIHEKGDCSAPDAASAGPHFNPDAHHHGGPDSPMHHAGDLGNITVGPDGTGHLDMVSKELTLDTGTHGVQGRSIVVHADVDDMTTDPSGKSGARIGCGVIATGTMGH